jgi:hypothetical protein
MAADLKRFASNLQVETLKKAHLQTKKGAMLSHNSLIYSVGTTRFELATTRPPGVKSLKMQNISV